MIIEKIINTIEKFSLLEGEQHITVALSGGADSMCLLFALLSLKEKLGVSISAVHINHLIRGEEAQRDEEFVKRVCAELGIDLLCEHIDVPKLANELKVSVELAARNARYDFFKQHCKGVIATAHNANDNIETLILNIARGTSLKGLCGIPVKRDMFIRPLLHCTREEIENYCNDNNISFVTDSTNLADEYTRNKIRHNIIPILKEINHNVEQNCLNMCESLCEDYSLLESMAYDYLKSNLSFNELLIDRFFTLCPSIQKQVIAMFVANVDDSIELSALHINRICEVISAKGKISLPGEYYAVCKDNKLSILKYIKENDTEFSINLVKKSAKNENINNLFLNNLLDCDKICGKLIIRTRLAGDKMRPNKRGITKTLKQLFTEFKIPTCERRNLPVLADDKGVIYVHGIGIAERCAVTEKTENYFIVEVKKLGDK